MPDTSLPDGAPKKLHHVIDSDNCITCPFCLHERWDDLYDLMSDGQQTVIECGKCDREFHVRTEVTVNFTSLIEIADDEPK